MAKKLVFDRTLWITKNQKSKVVVPKDELWKVGLRSCSTDGFYVPDSYFNSAGSKERLLGGGTTIEMPEKSALTGAVFKIVEE